MEEKDKKRHSLSRRITLLMAALMLVMAILVLIISYGSLEDTYMRLYNEKAQDLVRMLASEIDGEIVGRYTELDAEDEYLAWLQQEFNRYKSEFRGIQYLYLFHPEEDHWIYIVEGHKEGDDPELFSYLGDVYQYGETEYTHLVPDLHAGRASAELVQGKDVGYGKTVSAWAPVFDSRGNVTGMVQADCILSDLSAVVRNYAARIMGVMVLCMLIVLLLALQMLRRNVTAPLGRLTGMVDSYEHGAFSEARFKHDDEIQWLASSFGDMTRRIDAYTEEVAKATAEKERIGAELNVARQIQEDILPNSFPAFPERKDFDVIAMMNSCREIGGDFYDFFMVDDDHLALVVGDISDKGVPAALFMVIVKTLIKDRALQGFSPGEVLRSVSEQLLEGNEAEMFATVWLAILELSTGKGIAVNAGHEHPVLRRSGKRFEQQIYKHTPPVGVMEGVRFRDHGFQLEPGDTLFVYTDGLKDALNSAGERFGAERLLEVLNREPESSPSILVQTLKSAIDRFAGETPQADDLTMLCLKYYGPGGAADEWR